MKDLALLSFRQLIDHVITLAKRHFRSLFLPVAVPLGISALTVVVLQSWWVKVLGGLQAEQDLGVFFGAFGLFMLVIFLVLMVQFFLYQSLAVAALDAVAGRPVSLRRGFRTVLRPHILLTLLAVGVVVMFSFLMCLLPALYVVPASTFVLPAMVEEERRGIDAWKRSLDLVHFHPTGRFLDSPLLQTGVLLFVGFLLSSVATMVVQWPFVIAQQILIFRDAASGALADPHTMMSNTGWWLQVPAQVLGAMTTAMAWLYWTFGVALLYREIRRRREGRDLEEAIDALVGGGVPEQ